MLWRFVSAAFSVVHRYTDALNFIVQGVKSDRSTLKGSGYDGATSAGARDVIRCVVLFIGLARYCPESIRLLGSKLR